MLSIFSINYATSGLLQISVYKLIQADRPNAKYTFKNLVDCMIEDWQAMPASHDQ